MERKNLWMFEVCPLIWKDLVTLPGVLFELPIRYGGNRHMAQLGRLNKYTAGADDVYFHPGMKASLDFNIQKRHSDNLSQL